MSESYEQQLEVDAKRLLKITRLPKHEELLRDIQSAWPTTGLVDCQFCNSFMAESVELLKHSILLYESGYFDCAFYSTRQAIENLNNMLLLVDDTDKLNLWKSKGWFPSDSKVKETLVKINDVYNQVRNLFPEFFQRYDDLLGKANKYIHKQGVDTFYILQWKLSIEERTELFTSFLSCAIGMLVILFCALDPMALILADDDLIMYIHVRPMTDPAPIYIAQKYINSDFFEKIQNADFYVDLKSEMLKNEKLDDVTHDLLYYHYFDVEKISQIFQKQHLLDPCQMLMLCILSVNIKITHFFWQNDIIGYATSYESIDRYLSMSSVQFDECLKYGQDFKNFAWRGSYISCYRVFDTYMILQHYEKLSEKDICDVQAMVEILNKKYFDAIFDPNNI